MRYNRNPTTQSHKERSTATVRRAFVSSVPTIPSGNIPVIKIVPNGMSNDIPAEVILPTSNDKLLPSEGDEVYFLERGGDMAVVLGVVPREHDDYGQDERMVHHPTEDAYVHFDEDGDIHVHTEDTDVTFSDGTIQINDGDEPVVTDVETSTDTVDGTTVVTSVDTVTDDSILL